MTIHDNNPPSSVSDRLRIGIVQTSLRSESISPLESAKRAEELIRSSVSSASSASCSIITAEPPIDLFILPELSPFGYSQETFKTYLKPILDDTTVNRTTTTTTITSDDCSSSRTSACTSCTIASGKEASTSSSSEKNDNNNMYYEGKSHHDTPMCIGRFQKLLSQIEERFVLLAIELNCFICFGTIGVVNQDVNNSSATSDQDHMNRDRNSIMNNDKCTQQQQHEEGVRKEGNHRPKFTIRQLVVGPTGEHVTHYDKIHLCNYGDCSESRYFTAGSMQNLSSFNCRGFQVGISICADIRNPILYHRLVSKHKVDVLLQPAAFSRDISFATWESFRVTRAVENSSYFVGVNYAGDNYGESSLVGPWVDESKEWKPSKMGNEEGVLVKSILRKALNHVRQTMPFHQRVLNENW